MKTIKRIAASLRALGIVALALAVVLNVYAIAAGGSNWTPMRDKLVSVGADAGFGTRLRFDAYAYGAMHASVSGNANALEIEKYFAPFTAMGEEAQAALVEVNAQKVIEYFDNEFDAASYVSVYESRENIAEEKALTEAFDYLNSVGAPAPKGGKKLPNLKLADMRPEFETYYNETFLAEHPEDESSFGDFAATVAAMIKADADAGVATGKANEYLANSFTYEAYQAKLAELNAASEEQGTSADFLDGFVELATAKLGGEAADFDAFFKAEYEALQAQYADKQLPSYAVYLSAVKSLIDSGSAFDGSSVSIYNALIAAEKAAQDNSFASFVRNYSTELIATAKKNASLSVVSVFWKAVSLYWLFYLLGAAVLIAGRVVEILLSRALVRSLEKKHVPDDPDVLLRVNNLKQYFRSGDFVNKAVDDVSFYVKKGEVFGLVGESGCGKTTTGRTIINLYDPTEGDVYFQGLRISSNMNGLPVLIRQLKQEHEAKVAEIKKEVKDPAAQKAQIDALNKELADKIEKAQISAIESADEKSRAVKLYREKRKAELTEQFKKDSEGKSGAELEEIKQRYDVEMKVAAKDNIMTKMQMIFQDPIASINPRMTVREIIAEGLIIRGIKDKKYIDDKVNEMLELVGLVREHADRYPHEFSGGQRQRIGIARAIAMQPDLIIADEPISALDVSIQAQVINLLNDLRHSMGLTIMFIAHNLSVVKYFSDRIAVMYFGKIVEMTTSDELFEHPLHPYTKSLLSAIPYPDPHYEKQRRRIEYNPAQAHDYSTDKPTMREITPGHFIYCNEKEFAAYKKELGI